MSDIVGERVRAFYNKTQFPDYELDRFDSAEDLILSAYPFAKILDRSIPKDASIIDVGTGTGQLSAILSLGRECVWGVDFSDSSLKKAAGLKEKLGLDSLTLKKVDILDEDDVAGIGRRFDYVLCLGVLHHTGNPKKGFQNILKLLKPGGFVAVGLYNRLGRLPLYLRKLAAKTVFKDNDSVKDWFIRMQIGDVADRERARGWWNDQYSHPHESTHTVGEVLGWFKDSGVEYYQSLPSLTPFDQGDVDIAGVWNKTGEVYPYLPIRAYKQISWIYRTHHEGGYFIAFGRKNG